MSEIGLDIVEIDRISKASESWGARFLGRIFTEGELSYCMSKKRPAQHLAARFAAKEACMKSLGVGIGQGLRLIDIEVVSPHEGGKPLLKLHGGAKELFFRHGYRQISLSLTHGTKTAAAVVIAQQ
ncbi:MAG: holo-ACP synthase [Deltaproteobacteria bacterium]|nr:holo-ACP synthase [Deltaproteobacteria bacterium]